MYTSAILRNTLHKLSSRVKNASGLYTSRATQQLCLVAWNKRGALAMAQAGMELGSDCLERHEALKGVERWAGVERCNLQLLEKSWAMLPSKALVPNLERYSATVFAVRCPSELRAQQTTTSA
eukprot:631468-Amphidinium_carterae.2